jgi:hypothetical protein
MAAGRPGAHSGNEHEHELRKRGRAELRNERRERGHETPAVVVVQPFRALP